MSCFCPKIDHPAGIRDAWPGSRKAKAKSKSGPKPTQSTLQATPDEYIGRIDNAEGWHFVIDTLCDIYELPDLTTRSGLKKVHANFEAIYRRLDKAYEKHASNEKITGGIAGIYAKMSADVLLRNKLFDKGFLKRLIPLLKVEASRHLVLRALSSITHNGGDKVRMEIARESNYLAKYMQDFPDDIVGSELTVAILSHCLTSVVFFEHESAAPDVYRSLQLPLIIQAVTSAAKRPSASAYTVDHANKLICMATLNCTAACLSVPSSINFVVCGLRSKDWAFRCMCLGGLIRLHRREAQEDTRYRDPMKLMAAIQRGFPGHITEILFNYGLERCETTLTLKSSSNFQKAMMQCAQDHDLYKLGLTIADLIPRTEFSVAQGMFQSENPTTGEMETIDIGLPFVMWEDSLPHCAKAIRARGNPADADKADILDIKFYIIRQRLHDAFDLARKGIQRNPNCAYFYYALGLRTSKKGLKCKQITPFLKFQLMQRAVDHAGDMGINKLQDASELGDQAWQEGIAFLTSALEDSRVYIQQAPPDTRYMKNVLYWNILLRLTIQGPEMSTDLHELNTARRQLKLADEISALVGMPSPATYLRLTQATVLRLYAQAAEEWDAIIAMRDEESNNIDDDEPHHHHGPNCNHDQTTEDEIAAWVDGLQLDDTKPQRKPGPQRLHPKINSNHVELYRCSWCGNPSAILRKCSNCADARYCDPSCQKSHWSDHKKRCKVGS
ncbi:hypothetical protein BDZ89DRAFT_1101933 [Hymenopellis radicata]|nr:hypothetical protein BDZ89DRAFT_1101933 [Hymenopellis radicata]